MNKLTVKFKGQPYGGLEVIREDFAGLLRGFSFKVVEDVDIPESDYGARPKAVEQYCATHKMTMVTLEVGCVPFYYAVKAEAEWIKQRLSHLSCFTDSERHTEELITTE